MLLSSTSGCGSAPPTGAETPTDLTPSNVEPAPVAELVVGPDDRPELLLGYGRWRDPEKSVHDVLTLLGEKDDWRKSLADELGDKAGLLDLLAVSASFDFAFSLDARTSLEDPEVLAAVSIPITDFDAALAAAKQEGPVTQTRLGVFRVAGEACELWKTSGDAPARIICGPDQRDVSVLGPWLARGLPQVAPDPAALSIHLELQPFKDHFLPELRTLVDEGKAAGADMMRSELGVTDPLLVAAPGVVLEEALAFAEDWDGLRLFADFDSALPSASFGGTLKFSSSSSWFTQVLTETGGLAGPPSIFWQAPLDSDSVQFGHSSDPAHYDGIRVVVHRLAELGLVQSPLTPGDQRAILSFLDHAPASRGAWAYAQGSLPGAAPYGRATTARNKRTPASAVKGMEQFIRGYVGWSLVGVDDPSGPYVRWLADGHDVYGRLEAFARPMLAGLDPAALKLVPNVRFRRDPPGFPRGSATLEVEIRFDSEIAWEFAIDNVVDAPEHPPGPKAQGRVTLIAAIVPDGADRTWIGMSADKKTLRQKIESALRGAPPAQTIASRTDLEPLRKSAAPFGGYYTWGNSLRNAMSMMPDAATGELGKTLEDMFTAMPNHGATPILLVGSAKPGAEYGLAMHVQKGTFEDVVAAFSVVDLDTLSDMFDKIDEVTEDDSTEFQF